MSSPYDDVRDDIISREQTSDNASSRSDTDADVRSDSLPHNPQILNSTPTLPMSWSEFTEVRSEPFEGDPMSSIISLGSKVPRSDLSRSTPEAGRRLLSFRELLSASTGPQPQIDPVPPISRSYRREVLGLPVAGPNILPHPLVHSSGDDLHSLSRSSSSSSSSHPLPRVGPSQSHSRSISLPSGVNVSQVVRLLPVPTRPAMEGIRLIPEPDSIGMGWRDHPGRFAQSLARVRRDDRAHRYLATQEMPTIPLRQEDPVPAQHEEEDEDTVPSQTHPEEDSNEDSEEHVSSPRTESQRNRYDFPLLPATSSSSISIPPVPQPIADGTVIIGTIPRLNPVPTKSSVDNKVLVANIMGDNSIPIKQRLSIVSYMDCGCNCSETFERFMPEVSSVTADFCRRLSLGLVPLANTVEEIHMNVFQSLKGLEPRVIAHLIAMTGEYSPEVARQLISLRLKKILIRELLDTLGDKSAYKYLPPAIGCTSHPSFLPTYYVEIRDRNLSRPVSPLDSMILKNYANFNKTLGELTVFGPLCSHLKLIEDVYFPRSITKCDMVEYWLSSFKETVRWQKINGKTLAFIMINSTFYNPTISYRYISERIIALETPEIPPLEPHDTPEIPPLEPPVTPEFSTQTLFDDVPENESEESGPEESGPEESGPEESEYSIDDRPPGREIPVEDILEVPEPFSSFETNLHFTGITDIIPGSPRS